MTAPVISIPLLAIAFAAIVVVLLIGVIKELMSSSGIRCTIRDRWAACRQAFRRRGGGSSGMIDGFPIRPVTLSLVAMFIALFGVFLLSAYRSQSRLEFDAGLSGPDSGATTTTARPSVGSSALVRATLKSSDERLTNPAVVISGPATIAFTGCYAYVSGEKIDGFANGTMGRVGLGDLDSTVEVTIWCRFFVVRRIRSLEPVEVELVGGESADQSERLYLAPPAEQEGQEAAEAHADEEIRESPASWERPSMVARDGAFGEQGELWPLLDPHRLHGYEEMPEGQPATLRRLEDTRVQPSRIVSMPVTITSRPVTMEEFEAKGSQRRAIRQVFAVGVGPNEQGAWCTTTRSTAQSRLHEGDRIRVKAVVAEWGRSRSSGGPAVMLHCPALKVLGSIGEAVSTSRGGATETPSRFNRGRGR